MGFISNCVIVENAVAWKPCTKKRNVAVAAWRWSEGHWRCIHNIFFLGNGTASKPRAGFAWLSLFSCEWQVQHSRPEYTRQNLLQCKHRSRNDRTWFQRETPNRVVAWISSRTSQGATCSCWDAAGAAAKPAAEAAAAAALLLLYLLLPASQGAKHQSFDLSQRVLLHGWSGAPSVFPVNLAVSKHDVKLSQY